ncbi:MAG TPA: DinB family protein [Chloroflexia bacterium]|jgi:uncharacterized damage-inducible protein DinB|nr:DinB family protein [Chloroflexia bacterium]
MSTAAASELLYLLDTAFEGTWHSLLDNLQAVTPDDWAWVPPGGQRTIRDIVQHVGGCKFMYHDYAFGGGHLTWDDPLVDGKGVLDTPAVAIGWLRAGQDRLRRSIAGLDDADLPRPRLTNWGEEQTTRWIITAMIQHDLYHAGEINHLRSLHRQADRWAYDPG